MPSSVHAFVMIVCICDLKSHQHFSHMKTQFFNKLLKLLNHSRFFPQFQTHFEVQMLKDNILLYNFHPNEIKFNQKLLKITPIADFVHNFEHILKFQCLNTTFYCTISIQTRLSSIKNR